MPKLTITPNGLAKGKIRCPPDRILTIAWTIVALATILLQWVFLHKELA
jgi:hypothetical protein